jgi:hypothetical protein
MKRVGLVQPIVWNQRTGHVVAGHQRLEQLDSLEGRKDYNLDVAVIDVPEKTEKEINVFLNNELAQGTWDISKLDVLMNDGVDLGNCGFEKFELQVLLPSFAPVMTDALQQQVGEVGQMVADVEKDLATKRAMRQKIKDEMHARDGVSHPEIADTNLYLVLCFRNREESDAFLNLLKLPLTERYISGDVVHQIVARGITVPVKAAKTRKS